MRCVVVADDNLGMTEALKGFLGRYGWNVVTANDGVAALELVRRDRPDVALIDIGLPKMDGLEVARRIRVDGLACRLVAMSGFGTAHDRDLSQRAGFELHLVKPVAPDVLRAALEDPSPAEARP